MKITTVLEIRWGATEIIAINDDVKVGDEIETAETWPAAWGGLEVDYTAKVLKYDRKNCELHLRYKKEEQRKPRFFDPPNDVQWGIWKIRWDASQKSGTAIWEDEDESIKPRGRSGNVKVLQWPRLVLKGRKKSWREGIVRPGQAKLRKILLKSDKCCAISQQEDHTSLDVAHIIPANIMDYDETDNAILLRADLHRLFDAGLIRINRTPAGASFVANGMMSANYMKLLKAAPLSAKIFDRIAPAVEVRSHMKVGAVRKKR